MHSDESGHHAPVNAAVDGLVACRQPRQLVVTALGQHIRLELRRLLCPLIEIGDRRASDDGMWVGSIVVVDNRLALIGIDDYLTEALFGASGILEPSVI